MLQEQQDEVTIVLHRETSAELLTDAWQITSIYIHPLTRDVDANARDNNALLAWNKRAMPVLHPRLPAKVPRPTACNHVLSAALARPITFVPRLYLVCTACATRAHSRYKFLNILKLFCACEFLTAC